jgi:membrane protease YdiL (CAAX protease family)
VGTPDWEVDPPTTPVVVADGRARNRLVWETRFVMVAFLLPAVMAAVILFAQHEAGVASITRFPDLVDGKPVLNLVLGILDYLPVGAIVPLALFLLARTGQPPSVLGLGVPSLRGDLLPGLAIAAAAFGSELVLLIPLSPLLAHHSSLINTVKTGHVPAYYVVWGVALSAITAVTEEVLVNGYLITRLGQLGWTPRSALVLSLALRTSYHVYYGLGFLLTVPFGYLVTRSFQKHRKLSRPIAAHFLFDAILTTIAILA